MNSLKQSPASTLDFAGCMLINLVSVNRCVQVFLASDLNLEKSVLKYKVVFRQRTLYPYIMSVLYLRINGCAACLTPT